MISSPDYATVSITAIILISFIAWCHSQGMLRNHAKFLINSSPLSRFLRNFVTKSELSGKSLPMPSIMHLKLETKDIKPKVIIIGDVHGCLEELKELLVKCDYFDGESTLILLGDLVSYYHIILHVLISSQLITIRITGK